MAATAKRTLPDRVDRAMANIKTAVGQLALMLGDEDQATAGKAAEALAAVGPFAVGPLAAALPKGPSPRHRAAILGALVTFGPQAKAPVARALNKAMESDPDPHIRAMARAALARLILSDVMTSPTTITH